MKKISSVLIYIGAAGVLCGAIARLFDLHIAGIALFGYLGILAGFVLLPFAVYQKWNRALPRQKIFSAIVWVGLVLIPVSAVMKYFMWPGYKYIAITGCALLLIYLVYYAGILLNTTLRKTPIGKPLSSEDLTQHGITPTDLEQYTGKYTNSKLPLQIAIRETEGALIAQATGQAAFYLEVVGKGVFKYWKRDIVLEFNTEKKELLLKQHGGYFPFIKEAAPSGN